MVVDELNARTNDWHLMTDVVVDKFGVCVDRNYKRRSHDKCTDQFAKILIEFCSTLQCVPLHGNHSSELDGHFAFVSKQGKQCD